jgi:uncharacterized membrane protein
MTERHPQRPPAVTYTTDRASRSSAATGSNVTSKQSQPRSKWEQLLSNRRSILLMLFCVTGFLGLPLLWMSHAFSNTEKVVWSILNSLYTLALIGICVGICYWSYTQITQTGWL